VNFVIKIKKILMSWEAFMAKLIRIFSYCWTDPFDIAAVSEKNSAAMWSPLQSIYCLEDENVKEVVTEEAFFFSSSLVVVSFITFLGIMKEAVLLEGYELLKLIR